MIKMNLITGGSGFLGTNLTKKLLEKRQKVKVYDLVEPVPEVVDKVEFIKGNILDKKKLSKACKDVDVIYHTAALVPLSKAGRRFKDVNVLGTRNIVNIAFGNNVKRFVHVSSSAVYDLSKMPITEESPINPLGDYGRAKYQAERVVSEWGEKGLKFVIIRPRTILGEYRAGIFQILFEWVYNGENLFVIGDGKNLFQLISASDLSEACYLASKTKKAVGEIINIGNEKYGTFQQLLEDLINYAGTGSKIKHINTSLAITTLAMLDKIRLSPLADWHYKTMHKPFYFDITKAKKLLNWKPKDSNKEMVIRSYKWYVAHRDEIKSKKGTTHRTSPEQKLLGLIKKIY